MLPARKVLVELPAHRAPLVRKAQLAHREQQVQQARKELLVLMVPQAHKATLA